MKFTLTIESDNAAFEDMPDEVVRLVREVAEAVDDGDTDGYVHDANGNRVGVWSYDPGHFVDPFDPYGEEGRYDSEERARYGLIGEAG